jgi:glycosyltransferase involved in cell wall biosynthesis
MRNIESPTHLPLVSVLFITYKRLDLLRMSLAAFRRNTDYPNLEVIIADDGSGPEIQAQIRTLGADVYALAPTNRGLGANNNNGIQHCSGKYILMIQDDWECCGPADYLRNTIHVMESNPAVGLVNYCGEPNPIDEARPLGGSDEYCIASKACGEGLNGYVRYSDQPHVASRAATEHVGYYAEDRRMDEGECEEDYHRRWRNQTKFISAVFPKYYMRTYANRGVEQSFRTSRFRHRIDRKLIPVAEYLKQHFRPLYWMGRRSLRTSVRILERLHLVR